MSKKFLRVCVLTECNWKCNYCKYSKSNLIPDENKALKIFEKYKDILTHISGGEPGLLSNKFWDHVFNTKKVGVITNGLFILKGYYKKYQDKITNIKVHATPELNKDINPNILKIIREKYPNMETNIVIHKRNINLIKPFLKKYPDIEFKIIFSGTQVYPGFGNNIDNKITVISLIDRLRELPQYSYLIPKLLKAISSNNWNLCLIPENSVANCNECFEKCWIDV